MKDKEKILRWNLQEAIRELNSDVGECPIVSMAFAIREQRQKNVDKCRKELNEYLDNNPEVEYKKYIAEVKIQLEDAKKQAERIVELERTSRMTYDEFYKTYYNL